MMTERETADINIPDIKSDNELEEEPKEETPRNPEIILAMPVAPGSKKMKTVHCLLDMCAISLLMDPNFFEEFLGEYKETKVFLHTNKSQWATCNRVFTSKGKVTISNMCLPSFTMKHQFTASFKFLPEQKDKEHTYQIFLGMADLC
eukprot:4574371-Ditylum_brightwellii.AAC.2